MSYRQKEFDNLNQEFLDKAAAFFDFENPETENLITVLDSYNALVSYAELDYSSKKKHSKEYIKSTLETNRVTIRKAYDKLKIPLTLPGNLLSTIHLLPATPKVDCSETASQTEILVNLTRASQTKNVILQSTESQTSDTSQYSETDTQTENVILQSTESQTSEKMAQSKNDFFKMASSVIRDKFEGDPLKLDSFIEDAEFIESMTEEENKNTFLKFIKTKIAGRAKECLPEDAEIKTFEDIKQALKKEITPDSSLVIEGKMATLKLVKGNFTKFAEDAEKMAEAYRRSLISEKFTREKAGELTIRKTKEICRRVAHSEVAKSVIESTVYNNPAEVIATLITQTDIARKEEKDKKPFKKPQSDKNKYQGQNNQKYQKGQQNPKNDNQKSGKKFSRNQSGQNQKRSDKNDHVIRIVTDATPSTSTENGSSAQSAEQVFRYAQS